MHKNTKKSQHSRDAITVSQNIGGNLVHRMKGDKMFRLEARARVKQSQTTRTS